MIFNAAIVSETSSQLTAACSLLNLMVDCEFITLTSLPSCVDDRTQLTDVMAPVLDVAHNMGSSAYMTEEKAFRTMQALMCVLQSATPLQGKRLNGKRQVLILICVHVCT